MLYSIRVFYQSECSTFYDEEKAFQKVTMETLSTAHVLEVTVQDAQFHAYRMSVARCILTSQDLQSVLQIVTIFPKSTNLMTKHRS